MARKSIRKLKNYDFESKTTEGKFTKICVDMQASAAWNECSLRQQGLYLHIKRKFTPNNNLGTNNADDISIPKNEYLKLYGDAKTFRKDIDSLIKNGFIKVVAERWNIRECTIYGFSDRWKQYGKPGYEIPHNELRSGRQLTEEHRQNIKAGNQKRINENGKKCNSA